MTERAMKMIPRYILTGVLAAVIASAACRSKRAAGADGEEPRPAAASGPAAVTLTPEAVAAADLKMTAAAVRTVARRISAAGEIEWNARRVVHLTARTPGRLERVLVVQGDRVRAGQLLFQIDPGPYQAAVERAAAVLSRDRAQAEAARLQFQRAQALVERQLISAQEFESKLLRKFQETGG